MGLKAVGTLQDQDTERRSLATEQSNLAELKAQLDGASPEQQVQIQAQIKASEERVETLQNSVNKQYRNTIDSGLDAADVTNKLQAADRNLRESQDSYEATLAQADNKLVTDQRNVAKTFEEKKDAATALAVAERNAQFQMETIRPPLIMRCGMLGLPRPPIMPAITNSNSILPPHRFALPSTGWSPMLPPSRGRPRMAPS